MGNYELLKAAINEVIKANGRQEITGEVLNQVLLSMVNSLGAGYQCMGVATPSTNPGTPDQNVFYFATQAGTYTNFDAIVLQAGISVLIWNGDWASQTWFTVDATPTNNSQNLIASGAVFNALKLDGGAYDVSAHNSGATFASLSALLNSANLATLIPTEIRHGGMSIKFVQSSDNKYVQYLYNGTSTAVADFTNTGNWEKMNLEEDVSQLDQKLEGITNEHISKGDEKIEIFDNRGNKVVEVNPEFSDFKKLKSNGEDVFTYVKTGCPSISDKIIFESNEGDFIAEFSEEELKALSQARRKIYISSTDTEYDILNKFILADTNGNTDVIFERSTYTLSSIYLYMRDTLGWTGNRFGLPIGHNNRYYFNGSTIISNNPTGFTNVRDVLVTRTINGDYELYDGIIINNAGQYCIHDEGGGYTIPYSHYYKNMVLKYNGTSGQPFGCGTGFDANLRFEECIFETSWTGAITFAIHGPIVNPNNDPVSVDLRFNGCYFNSLNVGINQEYFDGSRDNLFLLIENCKMQGAVSDNNFEILSFNNSIS